MSDQVKQVALEEFEQAKVLARDAVRSAAYLYPLKVRPNFYELEQLLAGWNRRDNLSV